MPGRDNNPTPPAVRELPSFLQRTAEERAADRENQKKWAAAAQRRGARARLSADEKLFHLSLTEEAVLRAELSSIPADDTTRLAYVNDRLARVLARQGRHRDAYEQAASPELAAELRRTLEAIERPEAEECACPHPLEAGEQKFRIVEFIRTERHGGARVPLVECLECGFLNATGTVPEELARIERLMHTAKEKLSDHAIRERIRAERASERAGKGKR